MTKRRSVVACAFVLAISLDWSLAWVVPSTTGSTASHRPPRREALAAGWDPRKPQAHHAGRAGSSSVMRDLTSDDEADGEGDNRRRRLIEDAAAKLLVTLAAAASSTVPLWPHNANAASTDAPPTRDVLDQFGLELSAPGLAAPQQSPRGQQQRSSKWPRESPSPLPTLKRSAQELTQDPDPPSLPFAEGEGGVGTGGVTDMDKALRDASQKKRIDPRTHG